MPTWALLLVGFLATVGYLSLSVISWYLQSAIEYGMNSGQLGHHWFLYPLQCFAEEVRCYLPGGRAAREAFIRERVGSHLGVMISSKGSFHYEDIREKGNYEEVFYAMCGGPLEFWFNHAWISLLWPLSLGLWFVLFLVLFGVGLPISLVRRGVQKLGASA